MSVFDAMLVTPPIISFCIPCMNRLDDLRQTMPHTIVAALADPGEHTEVFVLDYNSSDGLSEYIESLEYNVYCKRYTKRAYYHMAHAWNLAAKKSIGEYLVFIGADAILGDDFVVVLRDLIAQGAVWMRGRKYKGIMCLQRDAFESVGGYDERFEFYGGEDKELEERLKRNGLEPTVWPDGLVRAIRTPNSKKLLNYRLSLTKTEMMKRGVTFRAFNREHHVLVANEGRQWGSPY